MLLLTLLCQSQASFVIVILFSPFFWRSGYSSIAASTPSSPTRPVNDKDHELLFTKYIFSIMTSVTAIDSSSAIERRMTPFHALNDSSSGRKQFVGGASCFTILCVYVKQGLPPAYDGRNTTILHFQFTPRAGKPCQNPRDYRRIITGESCTGESCFKKPGSTHCTKIGCKNLSNKLHL